MSVNVGTVGSLEASMAETLLSMGKVQPPMSDQQNLSQSLAVDVDEDSIAQLIGSGVTYDLNKPEVSIGRQSMDIEDNSKQDCILIGDKRVSRKHARIVYDPKSKNWNLWVHGRKGVTVNGKLYLPDSRQPIPLKPDSSISIVCYNFQFKASTLRNTKIKELKGPTTPLKPLEIRKDVYSTLSTPVTPISPTNPAMQNNSKEKTLYRPIAMRDIMTPEPSQRRGSLKARPAIYSPITPQSPFNSQLYNRKSDNIYTSGNRRMSWSPVTNARATINGSTVNITPTRNTSILPKPKDSTIEKGSVAGFEPTGRSNNSQEDGKPPYSYAHLIAEAITSSTNKRMTLAGIYDYISSHYDYFRNSSIGWQNSIRHNLSLNKAFMKVPKGPNETGKGMFWQIASGYEEAVDSSLKSNYRGLKSPKAKIKHCGGQSRKSKIDLVDSPTKITPLKPLAPTTQTTQNDGVSMFDKKATSVYNGSRRVSIGFPVESHFYLKDGDPFCSRPRSNSTPDRMKRLIPRYTTTNPLGLLDPQKIMQTMPVQYYGLKMMFSPPNIPYDRIVHREPEGYKNETDMYTWPKLVPAKKIKNSHGMDPLNTGSTYSTSNHEGSRKARNERS